MMHLRLLAIFFSLYLGTSLAIDAKGKNSIALFNLQSVSMDAIGADADLLYSLETVLDDSDQISVMSRRDIEAVLYRIGGAQVSETNLVVIYGQELGVDFVLTGEIDKTGSSIQVSIKLVDIIAKSITQTWSESYSGRGDILQGANILAHSIEQAMLQASSENVAIKNTTNDTSAVQYVQDIVAIAKDSSVFISWKIDSAVSAFYTNVYRAKSEDGLFEFVASVEENQYQDTVQGQYFYRLDLVLEDGSEVKGEQIVGVKITGRLVDNTLLSPTILDAQNLLHGIKIELVPQLNNQSVIGYNFYQQDSNKKWTKVHSIAKTEQLSYSVILDKNFAPNSRYHIYVTSFSNTGESEQSDIITLQTLPTLTLQDDNQKRLRKAKLSWQSAKTGTGYKIYRKDPSSVQWQLIHELSDISKTTYIDDNQLQDDMEYTYAISAYDQFTETPKSAEVLIWTKEPPLAPEGFTAQSSLLKKVKLTWQVVNDPDISGYVIFRKDGAYKHGDLLDKIAFIEGHQQQEYIDGSLASPLKNGEIYHYAIAAKTLLGNTGKLSAASKATTKALPAQTQGLEVASEADAILINWPHNGEKDIAHYTLYRRWNNEQWLKISDLKQPGFRDTNLKVYAKTSYRLTATDKDGLTSAFSETLSITSPLVLNLIITQEDKPRSISLSWDPVNNIQGYKLYRQQQDQPKWALIKTFTSEKKNEYTDFDRKRMRDGQQYQYKLSAFDKQHETQASNLVTGKTQDLPVFPESFTASSNEVKKVTLAWTKPAAQDIKGYIIQRKNSKDEFVEIKKVSSVTSSRYVDNGGVFETMDNGVRYHYRMASYNQFSAIGPMSPVIDAITKKIPETVSGLSIEQDANGLMFFWQKNDSNDISNYQVYRGKQRSCTGLRKLAKVNSTEDVYLDSNVKQGKNYCYRVTAIDKDKLESSMSNSVNFTLPTTEEDL
jgi:fibronectin type 3 domain-containing protein